MSMMVITIDLSLMFYRYTSLMLLIVLIYTITYIIYTLPASCLILSVCVGSHPSTRDPIALEADDEYKEADNENNVFVFLLPLPDCLSTPRRNGHPPSFS